MNWRVAARVFAAASLLLLASCPNVLMNEIMAKEAADASKSLGTFGFAASTNAKLYVDVPGTVDNTAHTIALTVPKWVPLSGLVATFTFQGTSVTVGGVAQSSGVTPNDFSAPVQYTVTPASGPPVVYTVMATTGAQGLMGGVIQGTPLALSGKVTTFAGQSSLFGNPSGVVSIGTTLYVADAEFSVIWKVDTNSGSATVYAGTLGQPGFADGTGTGAQFNSPEGLATDGSSTIWVADEFNERIRSINVSTGAVTTIAGQKIPGEADSATGTSAKFNGPFGLFFDGTSTLYVSDRFGKSVRTVSISNPYAVTSIINPVGGVGANTFAFGAPMGLTVAAGTGGNYLYVADNTNNVIYQFGPLPLYTVATTGNPFASGFMAPVGVTAYGSSPSLYVADSGNHAVQQVSPSSGAVTLYAGAGTTTGNGHVDGLNALALKFYSPNMLCFQTGTTNYMYVTEAGNLDIRRIQLATQQTSDRGSTLAGTWPDNQNGTGAAARFDSPRQMATNGSTIWLSDQVNELLRNMDTANAAVGTLAGQSGVANEVDGTGSAAAFNTPSGITTDGKSIYVCDSNGYTIRKVDIVSGAVTTLLGGSQGYADGVAANARFGLPTSVTTDGTSLYVVDQVNDSIRKVDLSTLAVTTIAGSPPPTVVAGYANNAIGTLATFDTPAAVATDGKSLFVTEANNRDVRQISLTPPYAVSTLAGPPPTTAAGYVNGTGSGALFRNPIGIVTDGTSVYVADQTNDAIRQIDIATGAVTTLAGGPAVAAPPPLVEAAGEIDGIGTTARFNWPIGITTDGVSLYVTDRGSNVIRRIQ